MIEKNLQKYAQENWEKYKKTITECSKPDEKRDAIINCEKKIYCFDDVCKDLFETNKLPASVDGIEFDKKEIRLIEYKTGFKDRITRDNYTDSEMSICKYSKMACTDYWNLFFSKRDKEKEELLSSIKMKALESYMIFEKIFFPLCDDMEEKSLQIRLILVVDADPISYMEESLRELAGKKSSKDNWHNKIKQSMSRFYVKKDVMGKDYLYDRIDVYSIQEYKNYLSMS